MVLVRVLLPHLLGAWATAFAMRIDAGGSSGADDHVSSRRAGEATDTSSWHVMVGEVIDVAAASVLSKRAGAEALLHAAVWEGA